MSTYVDPEEDEIFTRKTLEIAILIFSRKGNKKKKYAEKGKRRVESKPLGKISRCGSFWLTRKGLSRLRWHTRTRIGGPFPGNEKRSRSERRRSGKKRGETESTKRRIEHRPNRVEIWSYGVMHVGIWRT